MLADPKRPTPVMLEPARDDALRSLSLRSSRALVTFSWLIVDGLGAETSVVGGAAASDPPKLIS